MTQMLERAARAAAYEWFRADFEHEDAMRHADNEWEDFSGVARAVLMAVREPGAEMVMDVQDAIDEEHGASLSVFSVSQSFTTMIDAILDGK